MQVKPWTYRISVGLLTFGTVSLEATTEQTNHDGVVLRSSPAANKSGCSRYAPFSIPIRILYESLQFINHRTDTSALQQSVTGNPAEIHRDLDGVLSRSSRYGQGNIISQILRSRTSEHIMSMSDLLGQQDLFDVE